MKPLTLAFIVPLVAGLLSACAKPLPATYAKHDLNSFDATYQSIAVSPNTIVVPGSGTASYEGQIGGTVNGGGALLGDLSIDADFGASAVMGTVKNVNVLGVDGLTDQALGGKVAFSGSITGTALSATGTSRLSAVRHGFTQSADTTLSISGQFEDYLGFYDAISGTASLTAPDLGISATGLEFYAQ